jgi:hypothetical protein
MLSISDHRATAVYAFEDAVNNLDMTPMIVQFDEAVEFVEEVPESDFLLIALSIQ